MNSPVLEATFAQCKGCWQAGGWICLCWESPRGYNQTWSLLEDLKESCMDQVCIPHGSITPGTAPGGQECGLRAL